MNNEKIFFEVENKYNQLQHIDRMLKLLNIDIHKNEFEYKSLTDILKEVAEKWSNLDDLKQEDKEIKDFILGNIPGIKYKKTFVQLLDSLIISKNKN